jgi:hypothetical protein
MVLFRNIIWIRLGGSLAPASRLSLRVEDWTGGGAKALVSCADPAFADRAGRGFTTHQSGDEATLRLCLTWIEGHPGSRSPWPV